MTSSHCESGQHDVCGLDGCECVCERCTRARIVEMTTADILAGLPDRGWHVVRAPRVLVALLASAGLIHVQVTGTPDVFQARITGAGRKVRDGEP